MNQYFLDFTGLTTEDFGKTLLAGLSYALAEALSQEQLHCV
jgi:hypothetical protein